MPENEFGRSHEAMSIRPKDLIVSPDNASRRELNSRFARN